MSTTATPPVTKKPDAGKGNDDTGQHHEDAHDASKPIVINWQFEFKWNLTKDPKTGKEVWHGPKGNVSLTLNSDGSYNFAGTAPALNTGPDWKYEIALALGVKSSEKSIILFTETGSLQFGKLWNKQGNNHTIKDNWSAFTKAHDWHGKLGWYAVQLTSPQTPEDSSGSDIGSVAEDVIGVLGGVLAAIF